MSHRSARAGRQPWLAATLAMLLVVCQWATPSWALPVGTALAAEDRPAVVGGVALEATSAAGHRIYYDQVVPTDVLETVAAALEEMLADVPRVTGLPRFSTPIAIYLLADEERFRLALAEIGEVRIELVANEVGGYTIERRGTMLTFFPYRQVATPVHAVEGLAHELAHLAEREATARRPFPQWFNEGYASWVAERIRRDRFPAASDPALLDELIVVAALHSGEPIIPWAELVTRTRFSRAGLQGQGGLAYAQSTRFVAWLAERHGVDGLARFLGSVGAGASPTQAFESTLGPFSPQADAFAASLAELPTRFPPGLHRVSLPWLDPSTLLLVAIGAAPGEPVTLELSAEGLPPVYEERTANRPGLTGFQVDLTRLSGAGTWLARVSTPSRGALPATVWIEAGPRPAPAQLPRGQMLELWMRCCARSDPPARSGMSRIGHAAAAGSAVSWTLEGRRELRGELRKGGVMEGESSTEVAGAVSDDTASADPWLAGSPDDEGEVFVYEET